MKVLKSIHKYIPGFRQLSSNSMIIAATYYGAAILTAVRYWYWGLALLALPFFVFYLLDLNRSGKRRAPLLVSVTAGLLVLLGAAGGLSSGAVPGPSSDTAGTVPASVSAALPAKQGSAQTARLLSGLPATANTATIATTVLSPSATVFTAKPSASVKPGQFAYVAAKGGKIFHLAGCPSAKRIKPENLVGFATREEALAAGLQPCKKCKP